MCGGSTGMFVGLDLIAKKQKYLFIYFTTNE